MAEYDRDFKGVWIPKEVWLDNRLNALDKVILTEVDSLDQGEKGCYASNKYIAEFCQCSESKVSKSISLLIKLGYLYIQHFDGRQRELKSRLSNYDRLPSKKCEADYEKMLESNIGNNTPTKIDNNNIIDENFEKLWKMLKSHPNDRKSKVTKKRKKELYEMGEERTKRAIELYLKVQNPEFYHKRDNFLNEIIDNFLDKTESDFDKKDKPQEPTKYGGTYL